MDERVGSSFGKRRSNLPDFTDAFKRHSHRFIKRHRTTFEMWLMGYKYEIIATDMKLTKGVVRKDLFIMRQRLLRFQFEDCEKQLVPIVKYSIYQDQQG